MANLIYKWLKSENCSSYESKKLANKTRKAFGMTHKEYRKLLTRGREELKVLETLMSANRWSEIDFSKIPSKAGLIYKNAFARRDLIAQKYKEFIKSDKTTVNAKTLYPYDIVGMATKHFDYWGRVDDDFDNVDRIAIEKYWNNQKDYFKDDNTSMLCVVDTSGSMTCGEGAATPINVAISLGIYAAERAKGAFKNHYISFSSRPQLIDIEGVDFVDKVSRIYRTNLCENTWIQGVFNLLKDMIISGKAKKEDLPSIITIISDMEIDSGTRQWRDSVVWTEATTASEMEKIRQEWAEAGLEIPKLVYWNVNARHNTILDLGPNVSYVSGASPVIFEQVTSGVTGWQLCLDKLLSKRYEVIK